MIRRKPPEDCPDCGGRLKPVKRFGRGWEGPITRTAIDTEVAHYARADAERGPPHMKFRRAGSVHTLLCTECRRIFLYGVP